MKKIFDKIYKWAVKGYDFVEICTIGGVKFEIVEDKKDSE